MNRLIAVCLMLMICIASAIAVSAQPLNREPVKFTLPDLGSQMSLRNTQEREAFKLFDQADAAYWAGAVADLATSIGKREANPLWRDSSGIFSPGKNLAFKSALWAGFKALERRYDTPGERRMIRWSKYIIGGAWGLLAVRNAGVKQRR